MASGGKWSRIFATHSQVIPYPEYTNDHSARSLSGSQQLAFRRPLLWKTTLVLRREEFCGTDQRKNTSKSFLTLRISVTVELCFSLIDLSYNKFYSWFLTRARLVSLRKNFRFDASFSFIFLLNNYFSFHFPITACRSVMFLAWIGIRGQKEKLSILQPAWIFPTEAIHCHNFLYKTNVSLAQHTTELYTSFRKFKIWFL